MSRYIDADKLAKTVEEHSYFLSDRINSIDKGMFLSGILQVIDEQPEDDVRENVHGEWVRKEVDRRIHGVYCKAPNWMCSECKKWWFHNGAMLRYNNFCPNCGADMRGSEE